MGVARAEDLDPRKPLGEFGLDSLMAVELCNALGRSLGRNVPMTTLFDHPSLDALATHLLAEIQGTVPPAGGEPGDPEEDRRVRLLEEVEGLSEQELASQVADQLARLAASSPEDSAHVVT
jgi:acyl carrier protein